ncbi:MAG: lysophospholipid acyltransferase family protein [Alphaproteobacteria bacterium]|nr:lysophospholipid acyltransferase family protein [Alphaproteobacteria bacterium]
MTWLRSLLFVGLSVLMMVMAGIAGLPLLLVSRPTAARLARWFSGLQIRLLRVMVGLELDVIGLENLPREPVLIAVKHQSVLETHALVALLRNASFVIKREIVQVPIVGWVIASLGVIAIDRSGGASALKSMLRSAREEVAAGRHVVIFPEGTRVPPGESAPYHTGVAMLYGDLGIPVVPVALNTGVFWAKKRLIKKPGRAVIAFLPPIEPGLPRREFMETLSERIESESNRLVEAAEQA